MANPNVRVTVEGHADERGTRDYNLALGERRANAAKNYLVSLGVPESRISTTSYGKERPEALGSDESAWAQNRRAVTVTVQRSEEHTSELQSLMRSSYAVFCLNNKTTLINTTMHK